MGFRTLLAGDLEAGLDRIRSAELTIVLAESEALGDDPVAACSHLTAARRQHGNDWALVLVDVDVEHPDVYRDLVGAGADLVYPGTPANGSIHEWVRLAELRMTSDGFDAAT